jgi:hypothetical protein
VDVASEVCHAGRERLDVLLLQVGQRYAAVVLQGSDGGDEHHH